MQLQMLAFISSRYVMPHEQRETRDIYCCGYSCCSPSTAAASACCRCCVFLQAVFYDLLKYSYALAEEGVQSSNGCRSCKQPFSTV
jgi:hypothetical protein